MDALGLRDGETETDSLAETDGDTDGETDALGESDGLADTETEGEILGDTEGDTLEDGLRYSIVNRGLHAASVALLDW